MESNLGDNMERPDKLGTLLETLSKVIFGCSIVPYIDITYVAPKNQRQETTTLSTLLISRAIARAPETPPILTVQLRLMRQTFLLFEASVQYRWQYRMKDNIHRLQQYSLYTIDRQ